MIIPNSNLKYLGSWEVAIRITRLMKLYSRDFLYNYKLKPDLFYTTIKGLLCPDTRLFISHCCILDPMLSENVPNVT